MLSTHEKHGAAPVPEWLEHLADLQVGSYLIFASSVMPPVSEEDLLELLPYTGLIVPDATDSFMKWYRSRALFEPVTKCMWKSSVDWAYEYVPGMRSSVEEITFQVNIKKKVMWVSSVRFSCAPHIQLSEEHLSSFTNKEFMYDKLRNLPAEVGVQLVALKRALADVELKYLKKRSWVYWSAMYFRDAPKHPQLKQ